jgi:hypothetical protein
MKKQGLISAHIVKVYLDICLVVAAIVLPLLLIWFLLSPLVMSEEGVYTDATIPVTIGESSLFPVFPLAPSGIEAAGLTNFNLVKAGGELRFDTESWGLHCLTILPLLAGGLVVMWVIFLIRQVVASVIAGNPFTSRNAFRLRLVGFILLIGGIIGPFLQYVQADIVLRRVGSGTLPLSPPLTFPGGVILGGLMMLALSTVFGHGKELEDDKSLTI